MANILTTSEAATVLRCETTDADMLALLPLVDEYLLGATGHDWAADSTIEPRAKAAARMLLTLWHENPGMVGEGNALGFGLRAVLNQLEALALRYKVFEGMDGAGGIELLGAAVGDTVETLVGIIGVTGDQRAKFESVITITDQIQQVSADDLTSKYYKAYLVPKESL